LTNAKAYTDLLYDEQNGVATITINRPEKYNAFRGLTCDELIDAFNAAGWNGAIGVIVLTGAGTKAFCTGGDQSAHQGGYDGRGTVGLPMEALHAIIRTRLRHRLSGACSWREESAGNLVFVPAL
jgi:2-ketocyclohexanecarboxyl-CoA hydrolase